MADRPVVEICDAAWNPMGQLSNFDNLTLVSRACDVGTGALDVQSPTRKDRELLHEGVKIMVTREDGTQSAGVLNVTGEGHGDTDVSKPSWKDLNVYLDDTLLLPNTGSEDGRGPNQFDSRAGYTSTVLMGFVDANIGPGAGVATRRAPGVVMGVDPRSGVFLTTPVLARYDRALDFLRPLALSNGTVWDFISKDRTHYFQPRQVVDRAALGVVFSGASLGAGDYSIKRPEWTRCLALGRGEGAAQIAFVVTTPESYTQEQRWGGSPIVGVYSSSSKVTIQPLVDAAKAEADNAKVWDDHVKAAIKYAVDTYHDEDHTINALIFQIDDNSPGGAGTVEPLMSAVRQIHWDIGAALDELPEDLTDFGDIAQNLFLHLQGLVLVTVPDALKRLSELEPLVTQFYKTQFDKLKELEGKFINTRDVINRIFPERDNQILFHDKADAFALNAALENDKATDAALVDEAVRQLNDKGETVSASYEIRDHPFKFNRDLFVGDLVGIETPDGRYFVLPVVQLTEKWSVSGGHVITPLVGDYGASSSTGAALKTRDLQRVVDRLQTGR